MNNILLDKANKYVEDVLNGTEITTWEVKRQCQIYKDDLEKQNQENFKYFLSEKKVNLINKLLHIINFGDGIGVTNKPIIEGLVGFQAFLLVNIFGWRYKNNKKKMRYRDVMLYIARKNAKTFISALIFILLMLTEPKYSKFYSICLSKDLAKEVREGMKIIINSSPAIKKYFWLSKSDTGKIKCTLTENEYLPRTKDAGSNNAIKPAAFISDEHANFTDKSNYNAMRSGQKNIINPISIITTTAYPLTNSIIEGDLKYVREILKGEKDNDRYFALVYYADHEHLWDDYGMYQANPLRIEDNYNEIRDHRLRALEIEEEQIEYITKEMNVMMETHEDIMYIKPEKWKKCRVDKIDFSGKEVVVGLDLSKTTDLTAISMMYKDGDKFYCKAHGFVPEGTLNSKKRHEKIDYYQEERKGNCTIQKGDNIKYKKVCDYIRSLEEKYDCTITTIAFDPAYSDLIKEELEDDYDLMELRQTYTILSAPTKNFRDAVLEGRVFYEKNNLLDWNMSNATLSTGKADDIMLYKERKSNNTRIDLAVVLIFAYEELYLENEDKYDVEDAWNNVKKWNK